MYYRSIIILIQITKFVINSPNLVKHTTIVYNKYILEFHINDIPITYICCLRLIYSLTG